MESSKKWWVLIGVCLLNVLLNVDVMAVNLAIPKIAGEFHSKLVEAQWILNAFILFAGVFTILGGVLGAKIGNKVTFLIGAILFVVSSLGAALSWGMVPLILFRALQGFSLGLSYPTSIVLATEVFPKNQKALALGYIVGTLGIALGIGPIVGGLIVHYLSWRWIFYVNVPTGILTVLTIWIFCQNRPNKATKLDMVGFTLMTLAFFLTLYALNQVQSWGFHSLKFWMMIVIGIALFIWLYLVDRSKEHPYVYFDLFKNKNYRCNLIVRFVSQVVLTNTLFFFPVFSQNLMGYSPLSAGLQLLYLAIIWALCSPVFGKIIDRSGHKIPSLIGMMCYLIAIFFMFFYDFEGSFILPGLTLFFIGLGTGILFVATNSAMLAFAPEHLHTHSSGIFYTLAWLDNVVGLAIAGIILAARSKEVLLEYVQRLSIQLSPSNEFVLERVATGIADIKLLDTFGSLSQQLGEVARRAFTEGFHGILIFWLILTVIGILFSWLMHEEKAIE